MVQTSRAREQETLRSLLFFDMAVFAVIVVADSGSPESLTNSEEFVTDLQPAP